MAPLGWEHHALIQALLSRGPLKEREFHDIFAGITGKNPVTHKQLFNDCLLKINKWLDFVQFELRACMDQYDGSIYYGIVNNVSDEQSKLGTKYSVPQIVFYKAILEAMVLKGMNQGCITSIDALNIRLENQVQDGQAPQDSQSRIPAAFKTFTISQKEKTLSELIRDQWLSSTSDGTIGLGIRSFLDLRSWFLNNEVVTCHVCNEAAIKAEHCPKEGCPIRMHNYCLTKIFKRKIARVCPVCATEWHPSDCHEEVEEKVIEASLHINEVLNIPYPRKKRTRNLKAELFTADEAQSQMISGPALRKRLRSCKNEIMETEDAEPSRSLPGSTIGMRTRRSGRI
ncbi:uncharacterized protein LOC110027628 isoform X2 [Phalaenopsis equestris]|uniref:uncharacterized protein LOC110027628 isoform X2 n=1 Tax=Phalaenopsis equestris TaxID=78828 RepID=UPI0009E2AD1E|nr:uncharacterized protein LOC110027628 isoform X2 [Phalaenopsis equestris]